MKLLDGKKIAAQKVTDLATRVRKAPVTPRLVILRVGERADSASYVANKVRYGEQIGVDVVVDAYSDQVTQDALLEALVRHNEDPSTHGIIVQLPLPGHIDQGVVVNAVAPQKDVDGLTDHNLAQLLAGRPGIVPATPRGVSGLLSSYDIPVAGAHVVIVGRSILVGKSAALYFTNQDATVTLCHSKTEDLPALTQSADILITAVGKPGCIGVEHVRSRQVVVDVGISPGAGSRLLGDVDFDAVCNMVSAISPVPGGVGPMTVASLFENVLDAAGV